MKGWKEIKIADLGRVVTGKTPPTADSSYFGGEFNFVSPKDLDFDSRFITETQTKITEKSILKFKNQVLPKNSVMFTSLSYGFGKIGITSSVCLTNQQINSIIVNENHDYDFVYYLLRYSKDRILSYNAGIVTPIIPKSLFEKIKVFVPEKKEVEKKIGHILSAYDDLIENNLRRIKLLEELAQRTYEEWFVWFRFPGFEASNINSDWLPEGWERKKLGEIANINRESIKKGFKGTIRYVDISSVSTGNIDFWTEFDFDSAPGRARRLLNHGDIIWSCVRPNRKSYSLVWNPIKNLVGSTGFAVISPRKVSSEYLYFSITTESFVGYLSNRAGGTAYPAVTSSVFEEAEIINPSEEIDKEFSKFSKEIFDQIYLLKSQNRLLKESRDTLLPRLMSGEITLSESGFSGF
ncbi:type I restriction enzyme S subunit [Algoriphagus aquaeductus]|uniref:Type I restriction enzyme S subunit n=1 Tax=Algoriphagus aquaeductus TaxID=475299 RepID=A0A326RKH8_9BACT|nr:restriction endonuclease subunit S [Algoriphagus aquaeductus]PZV78660.1 type I restriction enzyme S subunit [Algoriphagus aquaeductus]